MKKIIVLGGGAIGSVFAAILSKKYDVLLIGRKNHVDKIKKSGLQITGKINKTFDVKAATKIDKINPQSMILLTVKAHETKAAVTEIKDKIKKDTIIVCIQNGLGSEDIVRDLVNCKVVRVVTMMGAIFLKEGNVKLTVFAPTFISKKEKDIAAILLSASIPVKRVSNINKEVWQKLVVNCVINGLGAILRVQNNGLNLAYLKDIKNDVIDECFAVAKKEGIELDKSVITTINKIIKTSTNTNSTLQDIMKHRNTEIDFLNGAIVKLGEKHNINTPVNKTIWGIVKTMENL